MQEKGVINTNQFVWMLFTIITSFTAVEIPALLIVQAGRDAWLAVIGGWVLDILLAIVYAYMGLRFPGQNFVQYSIAILGKHAGRMVGFVFPIFFLVACMFLMRGFSQLVSTFFFPAASLMAILFPALFVAAYAARQGIEVIGRVAEILGPSYLLSIIVIGLLVSPFVEFERLTPQFDEGVYPFLIGSPFILSFYGLCIMMAMFIPHCNRPQNGFLAKFIAVSLGAFFVAVIVILAVAIFGYEQAANIRSPGLELTRMISYGNYLDRLEIIWMLLVTGAGIIVSANLLWAFSLGMAQIVGLSTYKPLVYPAALLVGVLAITSFKSTMEQLRFAEYTFPIFGLFVEGGVEIFLFIAALVLKKRGHPPKMRRMCFHGKNQLS
ncbi:Spore germination protein YndE [Sporomusa acidovorans DSM 3132]|uniref:Spore germination protein YndE n=2 Tax=Sporomusa TaxID=2375 RepID=A0ABZ3J6E7_SPOA4|nr:endospore germination permease [Sporomusa acidovorans]OZC24269.1 spore germination protein YndE [Sporomusa acidovorans DSM 3132]SDF03511.1 spore germination protein (amino acid permease) [Sporomusa acidovorans]